LVAASKRWKQEGWYHPPPYFVRRAMLLTEARAIHAEIFVETGTFLGDTSWGLMNDFRHVYTLEVEPSLAAMAGERFQKKYPVTVIEGDSASILPGLCQKLDGPCLFYLDGHYSGGITGKGETDCPVIAELQAVFDNTKYPFRIVIDDARLFGVDAAYPKIDSIAEFLSRQERRMRLRVENDAIIIS
jgi:hypothetical protein